MNHSNRLTWAFFVTSSIALFNSHFRSKGIGIPGIAESSSASSLLPAFSSSFSSAYYDPSLTTSNDTIHGCQCLVLIGTGVESFGRNAQAISVKSEAGAAISFIIQGQLLGNIVGLDRSLWPMRIDGLTALFPDV